MTDNELISWLLNGDISIQYQVYRDLLGTIRPDLQNRIETEGWGKAFLSKKNENGHWGKSFYQPKWISTHYTLLDLRNLNIEPNSASIYRTIDQILNSGKAQDGGLKLGPSTSQHSDICVNGMFLNYASYFRADEKRLQSVVDMILNEKMADGGFNCRTTRGGAKHSSLHTTISVLEGFAGFLKAGYSYRKAEILMAKSSAEEFILRHRLYLSDRTGDIINPEFLKFHFPYRWKYDIMRALDYFRYAEADLDDRLKPALDHLSTKRKKDHSWNLNAHYPGLVHFNMENAGKSSRWITLRALRVLKYFKY